MSNQKQLFPGEEITISWSHRIVIKVPAGRTPQEVWEEIQLGKLDEEKAAGNIEHHEMYDSTACFYNDSNEQIDEDEKI